MDTHQKISIGIFGALLLGTMAMYSTGGLSSNALNLGTVDKNEDPCNETFIREYSELYVSDKATIKELQRFVGVNCNGKILESKKSYCEARTKQIETYSRSVKRYEQCENIVSTVEIR